MMPSGSSFRVYPRVSVASLYKRDLVTRHTGRTVRLTIEGMFSEEDWDTLTVLDFHDVAIIDFSCADEVVAKLVLGAMPAQDVARERFFLVRGLCDHHLDPLQSALRRRDLAVAAESDEGEPLLVGAVDDHETGIWTALCRLGRARAESLAAGLGLGSERVSGLLDEMYGKRLVLRDDRPVGTGGAPEYVSLVCAFAEAERRRNESST